MRLEAQSAEQTVRLIDDETFRDVLLDTVKPLLSLSRHVIAHPEKQEVFTRPLLARFQTEAARIEELLDAFGARNNRCWFPFRELAAAAKLFSEIGYILLHLRHTTPVYRLLPIEEDFPQATDDAINVLFRILLGFSDELLRLARELGFPTEELEETESFGEFLPDGGLAPDRTKRHIEEPGKSVCYLATAFLNLSEESRLLEVYKTVQERDYALCVPDSINEESLRVIENKFHNLQSLYDTYISDSDIEDQDHDLRIMRGHVSIIYHLLATGTDLIHYYERHMNVVMSGLRWEYRYPVSAEELLHLLMNYSVAFSHRFIKAAQDLCHNILRVYAELGRIEVPVPKFRGFHVRPSTLVAKIILHYGSKVDMQLEDEHYDASRPLELFRANEQINAKKRKFIAEEINALPALKNCEKAGKRALKAGLKEIWYSLLENHDLLVYDQNFSYNDLVPFEEETLAEYAKRWIAHCLALGKIDIDINIMVTFSGDKRVLEDLRLLAEAGYGEDRFGNNIVLPEKLMYLRQ